MPTRPRVYLADPDSAFRLAAACTLRDAGIDVVEFTSPAQLEARALAEEPDLVLLANGREGMEGQQVLARLRSPIHPRSSPLVLVTDRTQPFDCLAASVASLLQDWNRLAVHTVSSIVTWLQTRGKSGRLEMEALGARGTVLLQDGEITHASWKELRDREVLVFFAEKFPNAGFRFAERIPISPLQANGRAGTLGDRPARAPLPSPSGVSRAILDPDRRPAGRAAPGSASFQAEAHLELARTCLARGGWAEAFVHLRLAECLSAPRERVQALLGVAHLRTGDLQAALQELCKALRVDPLDDVVDGALREAVAALRAPPPSDARSDGQPSDGRVGREAAGGAREPGASLVEEAAREPAGQETSGASASLPRFAGPGAQPSAQSAPRPALAGANGADPRTRQRSAGFAVDPGETPAPGAEVDAEPLVPPVPAGPRVLTRALHRATMKPGESPPLQSLGAAPPEGFRRVARGLPPAAAAGPTPHLDAPLAAAAVRRHGIDAPPPGTKVAGHPRDTPVPAAALSSRRLDASPPGAKVAGHRPDTAVPAAPLPSHRLDAPPPGAKVAGHRPDTPVPAAALPSHRLDTPLPGAKVAGHRPDTAGPAAPLPSHRVDASPPAARANEPSAAAAASSPDGRERPEPAAPRYVPQFSPSARPAGASRRWSPARMAAGAAAAGAVAAAMFVVTSDRDLGDGMSTPSWVASVGRVGLRVALAPSAGDAPPAAGPLVDPSARGEGLTSARIRRAPHSSTPPPAAVPSPSLEELRSGPRPVPMTRTPAPDRVLDPRSVRALIGPSRELAIVRQWAEPEAPRRPATLWVLVDASGQVQDARILTPSGDARFDEKALRAVRNVGYDPAKRGDLAVAAWTRQRVTLRED